MSSAAAPAAPSLYLTTDEVRQKLEELTEADYLRLVNRSRYLAHDSRILADDLRQQAFYLVLCGKRQCRSDFDFVKTLLGIMRSIVSAWRKREEAGFDDPFDHAPHDPKDESLTPDRVAIDGRYHAQTLASIKQAVAGDAPLVRLLDAVMDGHKGAALEQHLGLTTEQLSTQRRRLRRRVEAATKKREHP